MSDYDLIRRDNEYQKEVRRRKMTDAAKIGLLVSQNIQQYQTNQILAQVHSEACRTNHFLGHMASTLNQIAQLQTTHFEQVQRERSLKEIMFQFGKFLDETEAYGDPIAAAYGMKRLFEILDRPGNGFSTADLADLGDKKHLDILITRAKSLLTDLPADQYEELEQFEKLLGGYYERKSTRFNAEKVFPKKQLVELPKEFQKTFKVAKPKDGGTCEEVSALTDAKKVNEDAGCAAGCGGFLVFGGLIACAMFVPMLIAGEKIVSESGNTQSPLGAVLLGIVMLLVGVGLALKYFHGKAERQILLESAEKEQEFALQRFEKEQELAKQQFQKQQLLNQQRWEVKKREEEAKIATLNQKIEADNAEIDEKIRQATKLYQVTTEDMRSLLNSFLDQHPPIQKFVSRV